MLYDRRWDRRGASKQIDELHDLIAWLEAQPPEAAYDFRSCERCMITQWAGGNRKRWSDQVSEIFHGRDPGRIAVGPLDWSTALPQQTEWTYGKAAARARVALMMEAV